MGLQGPLSGGSTKPVPGGKSQKSMGDKNPKPGYPKGSANVGRGRGIITSGTADVMGRAPSQQTRNAPGNYGGGYAGVTRRAKPAASRDGANRKGG